MKLLNENEEIKNTVFLIPSSVSAPPHSSAGPEQWKPS